MSKRFDVLRLDPQDKPIFFIVEAFDPDQQEASRYYYEEGSCPTNYISRVDTIIIDGDTDPHGLFEFMRSTEELEFKDRSHDPEAEWVKVVPEAFPGVTIDGVVIKPFALTKAE